MFNNVPPNGFPQIPDIEDLEKVVNDVSALQSSVSGLKSTKANKAGIAPDFSAEGNYSVGDLVYYEGTLYKCTTAHEAAAWDAEDFTETTIAAETADIQGDVSDLESIKANQITIAPTFSAETAYEAGELVYYNGLTYRCTNDHEGAWDAADFAATTIANELSELNSNITDLQKHNLDSTVVDITTYISGNNYTTPSDGYVRVSASTEAINVVRKNGTAFCILTGTGATELSAYVKKGTQLFVDNPSTAKFLPYVE